MTFTVHTTAFVAEPKRLCTTVQGRSRHGAIPNSNPCRPQSGCVIDNKKSSTSLAGQKIIIACFAFFKFIILPAQLDFPVHVPPWSLAVHQHGNTAKMGANDDGFEALLEPFYNGKKLTDPISTKEDKYQLLPAFLKVKGRSSPSVAEAGALKSLTNRPPAPSNRPCKAAYRFI